MDTREELQRAPNVPEHVTPEASSKNSSNDDFVNEKNAKFPDLCLVAKVRPVRSQCIVASLKGFEVGGLSYADSSIFVMACRPKEKPDHDNDFLLGITRRVHQDILALVYIKLA